MSLIPILELEPKTQLKFPAGFFFKKKSPIRTIPMQFSPLYGASMQVWVWAVQLKLHPSMEAWGHAIRASCLCSFVTLSQTNECCWISRSTSIQIQLRPHPTPTHIITHKYPNHLILLILLTDSLNTYIYIKQRKAWKEKNGDIYSLTTPLYISLKEEKKKKSSMVYAWHGWSSCMCSNPN